jgi:hypothetical protein
VLLLAFDTVDLLTWQTGDLRMLAERSGALGRHLGFPQDRALAWCAALRGDERPRARRSQPTRSPVSTRLAMLLDLAHAA